MVDSFSGKGNWNLHGFPFDVTLQFLFIGNYIVSYVATNLVCLPDKWKASDIDQTFGGFTESQIRSSVSGSLTSLVKRVKVSLIRFSG